jgi:ribosomal protein S18 acetylase RimI-like enzyme
MGALVRIATIRDGEPADAAGVAAIGRIALPETFRDLCDPVVIRNIVEQSYSLQALRDCITACRRAEDAHFLVAEREGRVVGFLHYDCEGDEPELHRIYLEPAMKRQGIGSSLMDELHRRLAPSATYILMVIAGNRPAVAFYQRHGFVEQAKVDGPTYMSEHMGVTFPPGTPPAPALVLRFTKAEVDRSSGNKGGKR